MKYIDKKTGEDLTDDEVLKRTVAYRGHEGQQLTGDRVSDYMLELVNITRIREEKQEV